MFHIYTEDSLNEGPTETEAGQRHSVDPSNRPPEDYPVSSKSTSHYLCKLRLTKHHGYIIMSINALRFILRSCLH